MSVVISDASCLILFTNIGRLDILGSLFGEIWITSTVKLEYGLRLPPFISVHDPIDPERQKELLLMLDAGEASSIALAVENPGCTILIDEKRGRRVAASMGLDVTGTVGVLLKAADQKLIVADTHLLDSLDEQGFHLSDRLRQLLVVGDVR